MSEENAVPAAVKRQQQEADKRRKAAYEPEETSAKGAPGGDEEKPDGDPPPEDTKKAEALDDSPTADEEDTEDDDKDWKAEAERLQAALSTLRGKYDSEVPRLARELRETKDKIVQTEQQLAEAKATGKPAEQGTGDAEVDAKLAAVREEYGEDLVETLTLLARRMVNEAAGPINERVENVSERQQKSDQHKFYTDLATKVEGNWQEINVSPDFHTWLAETDPMTGAERQASLKAAYEELNADRVSAIFNLYLKERGKSGKPEPTKSEIESQVAPDKRTTRKAPEEPSTFTSADMKKLEREAREGRISETEYRTRMSEIQKAIHEGRYRPA